MMAAEKENIPSYVDCVTRIHNNVRIYLGSREDIFSVKGFFSEMIQYGRITAFDGVTVVIVALLITITRAALTKWVLAPYATWMRLTPLNQTKFPESVWKTAYYAFTWGFIFYALIFKEKYDYFYEPNTVWSDWQPGIKVPTDIYILYVIEFGYYLHSCYAAVYMDHWRKDSLVMIFHHLLTMALIGFSYAIRYHKIGFLVLFLHDGSDVCLEFSKCSVYMKIRDGKYHLTCDILATGGFIIFALAWFVCRLYWFPLKVLYSSGHSVIVYGPTPTAPFYLFFNVMLWILQFLNIYWFMFILNLMYKVATGQMKEVDDVRESDVMEQLDQTKHMKNGKIE